MRPLAALATAMLVLAACTPQTAPAPTTPPAGTARPGASATAAVRVDEGGTVTAASTDDVVTLQPVLVNDPASAQVTSLLYEGLITVDPRTGAAIPDLATFSVSGDGRTYTFDIDPKATWSDGAPIVARDYLTGAMAVGRSARTVRKSSYAAVSGFKDYADGKADTITGIRADGSDPKRLVITLDRASCTALLQIGYTNRVIPSHVFGKYLTSEAEPAAIDSAPENTEPRVSSGPFLLGEWRKGERVVLKKNPRYFRGAPHLDEYVFRVFANADDVVRGLGSGEVTYGRVQPIDLALLGADALSVTRYPSLGYTFIAWDLASANAPALADRRVRRAFAYGLDMDSIIKAIYLGEALPHFVHHVPAQWAFPGPGVSLEPYRFDQGAANRLLDEAGWPRGADGVRAKEGRRLSLTISTNTGNRTHEALARVAADQYRQLGVDATVSLEPFESLVAKAVFGDTSLDAMLGEWDLAAEPDPYLIWHSSQIPDRNATPVKTGFGFTHFSDGGLDRAIDDARAPANGDCSAAARKRSYDTFNRILNDAQPYNFGVVPNVVMVAQRSLQGFAPGPYSVTHNVEQWWRKR